MLTASRSVAQLSMYQLVDGMLDEGLTFVASYLERIIKLPIIITDSIGQIHYPDIPDIPVQCNDIFINFPPNITNDDYYYQKVNRCLYYYIKCNGSGAYIIVKNVYARMLSQTVSVLSETKLAIKCYFSSYFSNQKKMNEHQKKFEWEMAKYLSRQNNADIRDIIKLSDVDLDLHKPYFVEIIELDETNRTNRTDWHLMCSFFKEYMKSTKLDVISIAWPYCLIVIVPARFKKDSEEVDPYSHSLINSIKYKEVIENRFNIATSKGIGQAHSLLDLHKSYHEARLALTLSRIMGKKHFIQRFSELGVFSFILSQDIDSLKNYCLKTLGPLIEYDNKADGDLLSTLRILLDSNFNWKHTAVTLFIHVNTLHYRVDKIEKLLNVDFSEMNTRLNLYTAIKIWDSLTINGL